MRFLLMLFGLAMIILAGLWFFTPVLDAVYVKHVPQYAQSRSAGPGPAVTPGAGGASRSAGAPAGGSGQIVSKALTDNVVSMVNLLAVIMGAWFTFMSYRLQARGSRRDD